MSETNNATIMAIDGMVLDFESYVSDGEAQVYSTDERAPKIGDFVRAITTYDSEVRFQALGLLLGIYVRDQPKTSDDAYAALIATKSDVEEWLEEIDYFSVTDDIPQESCRDFTYVEVMTVFECVIAKFHDQLLALTITTRPPSPPTKTEEDSEIIKQALKARAKVSKAREQHQKAAKDEGDYLSKIKDTRPDVYNQIQEIMTIGNLYAAAFFKLESKEARQMLDNIMLMSPKPRTELLSLIPFSALVYPSEEVPGINRDDQIGQLSTYLHDSPKMTAALSSILGRTPNERSVLKQYEAVNADRKYKLAVNLPDPTATGGGCTVTIDTVIPVTHNKIIFGRNMSEGRALSNTVKVMTVNYKETFGQDLMDVVYQANMFVNMDPKYAPSNLWSRFSIKVLFDSQSSSAAYKKIQCLLMYSLRSGKGNKPQDPINRANIASIPLIAYGGDRNAIYSVAMSTKAGREVIRDFEERALGQYEEAPFEIYADYYMSAVPYLVKGSLLDGDCRRAGAPVKEQVDNNGDKFKGVVTFTDEKFSEIIKVLAGHQGMRFAIQDEMGFGGTAIAGILNLLTGLRASKRKALTVCCHTLVLNLGVEILMSDYIAGQNVFGEFVPADPARRKDTRAEAIVLNNDYEATKLDENMVNRFARRSNPSCKTTPILVDLTVPGRLYCPQNEEKKNLQEVFRGKNVLHDDKDSRCLYSPDELSEFDGFMVYFSLGVFLDKGDKTRKSIGRWIKLFTDYDITFSPTTVMHYFGVYMIGVRKKTEAYDWSVRSNGVPMGVGDMAMFKKVVVAHVVAKLRCFINHYDKIPGGCRQMFVANADVINSFSDALKPSRVSVGTRDAYEHLVKASTSVSKTSSDLGADTQYESYFGARDDGSEISSAYKLDADDEKSYEHLFE